MKEKKPYEKPKALEIEDVQSDEAILITCKEDSFAILEGGFPQCGIT
ncbi:hypothetical protein GF324_08340, partial [bacterium]|nr:hypothetical protein [bacterium]